MFDWINPLYGWLGLGGVIIAACVAVAIYFPPFRKIAIAVAVAVGGVLAAYSKGASDAKRREREKSEKAVAKVQAKYSKIDARSDGPSDVSKRMRDGEF